MKRHRWIPQLELPRRSMTAIAHFELSTKEAIAMANGKGRKQNKKPNSNMHAVFLKAVVITMQKASRKLLSSLDGFGDACMVLFHRRRALIYSGFTFEPNHCISQWRSSSTMAIIASTTAPIIASTIASDELPNIFGPDVLCFFRYRVLDNRAHGI